jgi:hypothetical protein
LYTASENSGAENSIFFADGDLEISGTVCGSVDHGGPQIQGMVIGRRRQEATRRQARLKRVGKKRPARLIIIRSKC